MKDFLKKYQPYIFIVVFFGVLPYYGTQHNIPIAVASVAFIVWMLTYTSSD